MSVTNVETTTSQPGNMGICGKFTLAMNSEPNKWNKSQKLMLRLTLKGLSNHILVATVCFLHISDCYPLYLVSTYKYGFVFRSR
jgi:hypothetical protein